MKTKLLRCDSPGCRTLTSRGLCDRHREQLAQAIETSDAKSRDLVARLEEGNLRFLDSAERDWMREDLERLRAEGERVARSAEQPVFSELEQIPVAELDEGLT